MIARTCRSSYCYILKCGRIMSAYPEEEKKLDYIGIKSDHLTTMVVFLSKFKENKIPSSERLNGLYKTGIFHTAFSARLSCPHSLCFSLSAQAGNRPYGKASPYSRVLSSPPSISTLLQQHTHSCIQGGEWSKPQGCSGSLYNRA